MTDAETRDRAAELLVMAAQKLTCRGGYLLKYSLAGFVPLIQDLPASEHHHHSWPSGLLDHSLEVALGTLSRILAAAGRAEAVAQLAAPTLVVALFHDLGKLFHVLVEDSTSGRRWNPLIETLAAFRAGQDPVTWRAGRGFAVHFGQSHLVQMLTPPDWTRTVVALSERYGSRFRTPRMPQSPPLDFLVDAISRADGQSAWHGQPRHRDRGGYLRELVSSLKVAA